MRLSLGVEGETLVARFAGSADGDAQYALSEFFDKLEAEVRRTSSKHVVADIRELEFATSSCLKVFATWLVDLGERQDHVYNVEFRSNNAHRWQYRSLNALASCAPDRVQVVASS
jgi:hypothetical protein